MADFLHHFVSWGWCLSQASPPLTSSLTSTPLERVHLIGKRCGMKGDNNTTNLVCWLNDVRATFFEKETGKMRNLTFRDVRPVSWRLGVWNKGGKIDGGSLASFLSFDKKIIILAREVVEIGVVQESCVLSIAIVYIPEGKSSESKYSSFILSIDSNKQQTIFHQENLSIWRSFWRVSTIDMNVAFDVNDVHSCLSIKKMALLYNI